jgi:hypothetical protein
MAEIELGLRAEITWSGGGMQPGPPDVVIVRMGETQIAELPITADRNRAGDGDDSTYFYAEDRRVVEETVAPFLRRLFSTDKD